MQYQTIYNIVIRHVAFLPNKSQPKNPSSCYIFQVFKLLSPWKNIETLEKCCPLPNKVLHQLITTVYVCWVHGQTPYNDSSDWLSVTGNICLVFACCALAPSAPPCKSQRSRRPGCQAAAVAVIGLSKFDIKAILIFIVE